MTEARSEEPPRYRAHRTDSGTTLTRAAADQHARLDAARHDLQRHVAEAASLGEEAVPDLLGAAVALVDQALDRLAAVAGHQLDEGTPPG